jgi:DNA-binding NtrC family response regulator
VRHLEHLSARLALEPPDGPVTPADVRRLLDTSATSGEPGSASSSGESDLEMEMGLPALLAHEERKWLQKALERHPELTRADLAAKLKISEAALYKKLRMYHLSG